MPNLAKLQETLDDIVKNPELHDQGSWIYPIEDAEVLHSDTNKSGDWNNRHAVKSLGCETAFCVAGNRVHADGYAFVGQGSATLANQFNLAILPDKVEAFLNYETDAELVSDIAARAFELDEAEADLLFASTNSLLDCFAAAYAFTNGALKLPAEPEKSEYWQVNQLTEANVLDTLNQWLVDEDSWLGFDDQELSQALRVKTFDSRWRAAVLFRLADLPTVEDARQQERDDDLEGMRTALGSECLDHDH